MYRLQDVKAIREKSEEIRERTERELHLKDLPWKKRVLEVAKEFVRTHDRVVYGGFALNAVVSHKAPEDAFYDDEDAPDIEFYSTDPVKDASDFAAFLYRRGLRNVNVLEASHYETYSVSVDFWRMCDVSYMAPRVYAHLPSLIVEGIRCLHPRFAIIDFMRIINDPTHSYHILEKTADRLGLIMRHYPPFAVADTVDGGRGVFPAPFRLWTPPAATSSLLSAPPATDDFAASACRLLVKKFAMNRTSLVVVGQVAVVLYCTMGPQQQQHSPPLCLEAVTDAFVRDAADATALLVAEYGPGRVKYGEKEALYDFVGRRGVFYVDGVPVLRLIHDDWRCHPFLRVPSSDESAEFLQMGSFSQAALRLFVDQFEAVVNEEDVRKVDALEMTLYAMYAQRNAVLEQQNMDVTSTTSLYRDFIVQCKGQGYAAVRLKRLFAQYKRKELGQMPFGLSVDEFMERGRGLREEDREAAFQRRVQGTYYLPRDGRDVMYSERFMFSEVAKWDAGRLLLPGVSTEPPPPIVPPAVDVVGATTTTAKPKQFLHRGDASSSSGDERKKKKKKNRKNKKKKKGAVAA